MYTLERFQIKCSGKRRLILIFLHCEWNSDVNESLSLGFFSKTKVWHSPPNDADCWRRMWQILKLASLNEEQLQYRSEAACQVGAAVLAHVARSGQLDAAHRLTKPIRTTPLIQKNSNVEIAAVFPSQYGWWKSEVISKLELFLTYWSRSYIVLALVYLNHLSKRIAPILNHLIISVQWFICSFLKVLCFLKANCFDCHSPLEWKSADYLLHK